MVISSYSDLNNCIASYLRWDLCLIQLFRLYNKSKTYMTYKLLLCLICQQSPSRCPKQSMTHGTNNLSPPLHRDLIFIALSLLIWYGVTDIVMTTILYDIALSLLIWYGVTDIVVTTIFLIQPLPSVLGEWYNNGDVCDHNLRVTPLAKKGPVLSKAQWSRPKQGLCEQCQHCYYSEYVIACHSFLQNGNKS